MSLKGCNCDLMCVQEINWQDNLTFDCFDSTRIICEKVHSIPSIDFLELNYVGMALCIYVCVCEVRNLMKLGVFMSLRLMI